MKNYNRTYEIARKNLLLMIILTIINIIFVFFNSNTVMLFSASVPYIFTVFGYYYADITSYIIAVVPLILYIVCFIFSKNNYRWMIVASILFILDTLYLIYFWFPDIDISLILDVLIHIWVLYYLISGWISGKKINDEEYDEYQNIEKVIINKNNEIRQTETQLFYENKENIVSSSPIRIAQEGKERILLESDAFGKHIVYRRVGKTNELVVNGYVYDEYVALMEMPHNLTANINGHIIEAGIGKNSKSYIKVNGIVIVEKLRLI